jgi:hypothetical protein
MNLNLYNKFLYISIIAAGLNTMEANKPLSSYMKNCNWFDEEAFENQSLCVHQQYVKKPLNKYSDKSFKYFIYHAILNFLKN